MRVKGDASKSGSEIDSCARSMEDVNGSKKDLSASAGESAPAREVPRLRFNQSGMRRIKTPSLCNLSEAPLQTLGKTGTICVCSANCQRFPLIFIFVSCSLQIKTLCSVALKEKKRNGTASWVKGILK